MVDLHDATIVFGCAISKLMNINRPKKDPRPDTKGFFYIWPRFGLCSCSYKEDLVRCARRLLLITGIFSVLALSN